MKSKNNGMIPVLTTPAGNCLTGANWQEAGVSIASFYLTALLMKPGYEFLKSLPNLAHYSGWQGTSVLNASSLLMAADGKFNLRSHYDGRCSHYSVDEILNLITTLQPNIAIFPQGISQKNQTWWQSLPETIMPFVHVNDLSKCSQMEKKCGVYIRYDGEFDSSLLLEQLQKYNNTPCYIMGDLSLALMRDLNQHGAHFVESDLPASDAYAGKVYNHDGVISLQTDDFKDQFEVIDSCCNCPTCSQMFTKSYLHHLLEHTPLLCQRYLIQHNMYYCQQAFCK